MAKKMRLDEYLVSHAMAEDLAQARAYVQIRKDIGDQLNISRMQRHKDYIDKINSRFNTTIDFDSKK